MFSNSNVVKTIKTSSRKDFNGHASAEVRAKGAQKGAQRKAVRASKREAGWL